MRRSAASPSAPALRSSRISTTSSSFRDAGLGTWIVRGFGTAIMHGGATAIFAVMSLSHARARARARRSRAFVPGFALAVVLHSAFNHLTGVAAARDARRDRRAAAAAATSCSQRSERAVARLARQGFDADTEMLESINVRPFLRFAGRPVPRVAEATGSRGRSSRTCSATCGCIRSSRCAPRAS